MFIEKIFYEFYKNEMYGIYAKCIFPIMNKFFYKDVVFKILCGTMTILLYYFQY